MRVSYLLRLSPAELAQGRLAGEVEEVATGRLGALGNIQDLLSFCCPSGPRTGEEGPHDGGER